MKGFGPTKSHSDSVRGKKTNIKHNTIPKSHSDYTEGNSKYKYKKGSIMLVLTSVRGKKTEV